MFDIKLSELRESLVECYAKNNTATLTTAFINLIPDKTNIPQINVHYWILSKFLGSPHGVAILMIRGLFNREKYTKFKSRRLHLHQVAKDFIKDTDRGVNSAILRFLQNSNTIDYRLIHEFYLAIIDYVLKKYGDIKLPRH